MSVSFELWLCKRINYNHMQGDKQQTSQQNEQQLQAPSIAVRKNSTEVQCDICFQPYHILGKWPMIACPNQHFFCDHCVEGLLALSNDEPSPCPICRALIKRSIVRPHVALFRKINQTNTVKDALKEQSNELFLYAFQYQIFEVASLFKENKINQLQRIERLDLSQRGINKIEHLTMLRSLTALHLENNLLQSLKGIQALPNLKILNLNRNQLTQIDALGKLDKLQNVAVEFNRLTNGNLFALSKLKHLFLLGNPLGASLVDQLLMVEFPKMTTFSFSINDPSAEYLTRNFLESLSICETLPSLKKLIVDALFNEQERKTIQMQAVTANGLIQIEWIGAEVSLTSHDKWLSQFFKERQRYGQAFKFVVDPLSPHIKDYKIEGRRVIKNSCNFTSLNCAFPIPKQGKQSFKFFIVEPSQHFFVGITNAFLKHNANIYSEHFVGLTFWGTIYSRGDCLPLIGKVRYEEQPIIRITVNFQDKSIHWYSDEKLIGAVPLPPQFKHSQLYFLFGMRDEGTSIELLDG